MKNGPYTIVKAPSDYPGTTYRNNQYVYEHQLVWWQETGNLVPEGFVIHHKNDKKRDNKFSNLELKSRADHTGAHSRERTELVDAVCFYCDAKFEVPAGRQRVRLKQNKNGRLFCCRSHQVKQQWVDNPKRLSIPR
jgi:hypothetical protein